MCKDEARCDYLACLCNCETRRLMRYKYAAITPVIFNFMLWQ